MKSANLFFATAALLASMSTFASEPPAACAARVESAFSQMKQGAHDTVPVADRAEVDRVQLKYHATEERISPMHDVVSITPWGSGFETVMAKPIVIHKADAEIDIKEGIVYYTHELCDNHDDVYIQGAMGHEFGHLLTAIDRPDFKQAMVTKRSLWISAKTIEYMASQYEPKIYRTMHLDAGPFLAELDAYCKDGYEMSCRAIDNWHEGETY